MNATTWTVRIIAGLGAVSAAVAVGLDLSSLEQRIMDKYGERSPEHEFFRKLHLGLTIYNTGSLGCVQ